MFYILEFKSCEAELVEAGAIKKRGLYYKEPAFDKLRLTLKLR
jgi:hypothetical protein